MSAHGSVFSHRCLIEKRRVLFIWANVWSWNGPSPQPLPLLLPVHAYSMQSHLTFCLTVVVKHLEYHMQVFDWYCLKKAAVNSSRVGWTENLKGFQKRLDIEFEMSAETKPQLALMANFRGVAMTESFWNNCIMILGHWYSPTPFFMTRKVSILKKPVF